MTPYAPQGTSLQKDAGADAVTVVDTEFLNIKYSSHFLCKALSALLKCDALVSVFKTNDTASDKTVLKK